MTKATKWIVGLMVSLAVLTQGGCISPGRGMLAPRSGELFQTTRMGVGEGTCCFSGLTIGGLRMWFEAGQPVYGIPFAVIGLPFAVTGFVVDECVVSPLTDLVCLPYDLCQPNHGFYIRLVDETGKPVPNAKISGEVRNGACTGIPFETSFDGTTDVNGEYFVSRLCAPEGFVGVSAAGYRSRHYSIEFSDMKKDADGRLVLECVLVKGSEDTSGPSRKQVDKYVLDNRWAAKKGLTRNEVLALLPGTWSADAGTRKLLATELGWPSARTTSKHRFTLDASQGVVSQVPECYQTTNYGIDPWGKGPKFAHWQLLGKGEGKLKRFIREPLDWQWTVQLLVDGAEDDYFLGEDKMGPYLSPVFLSDSLGPGITLKFRKVVE